MKNATLKKRVLSGLISTALLAGTGVAVAPTAGAATAWASNDSAAIVGAYEKLSLQDEATYRRQLDLTVRNAGMNLLPTTLGPGFCIDWLLKGPWDNIPGGYELRKLTGASGRVGTGYGIDKDVQAAAINLTKELMREYKAGNSRNVVELNAMLQALLGNNLGGLNDVRSKLYYGQLPVAKFERLTGFKIGYTTVQRGSGIPNYILVPNQARINEIKQTIKPGEYVTVLVPRNYNLNLNPKQNETFQRIVTIVQPGLDPNPPKPEQKITETVYTTPPAKTVTETVTRPAQTTTTTVPGTPSTFRTTYTLPPETVTRTSTLPTKSETVYVTTPGRQVVTTTTPAPLTQTVTETVSGTPETRTVVEQLPPVVTTKTENEQPTTVTSTVTAVPVTETVPGKTTVETVTVTPEVSTTVAVPAKTEVVTKTVTPAPVSVTTTVVDKEYYYTEKVSESVTEVYEYYYFAGFSRDEKSKTIQLPGNIKGSWTFEVTKGRDIVIVERSEDGKLIITPRPDFKGNGEVEILITDAEGNQYIYKVNVSQTVEVDTTTQVKVNNFFYTINPGSTNRVRVIPKKQNETFQWSFVDKDGNPIKVKPGALEVRDDETSISVTVNDSSLTGNIVIRVNEESGEIRENIITVENITTEFDAIRQILNTSTAMVENRGGGYKITEGSDLVEITVKDGNWVIKPKDGATGQVKIVFTDAKGVEYKYTFDIVDDPNAGPKIVNYDLKYNKNAVGAAHEDRAFIERRAGWSYTVVSGNEFVEIVEGKGQDGKDVWIVRPKNDNGTAVIHVKDENGTVIGIWTIGVTSRDIDALNPKSETYDRNVTDRTTIDIYRGEPGIEGKNSNFFEIVDGEDLLSSVPERNVTATVEYDANGQEAEPRQVEGIADDLKLKFKAGAVKPGETKALRVREYQYVFVNDGNGGQEQKPFQVTEYVYNVTAKAPRELTYAITADNELNLNGTKLYVTEVLDAQGNPLQDPSTLFADGVPQDGQSTLKTDFKRDADGTIVVENRTEEGFVFERYTISITPGQEANYQPVVRRMAWDATATIVAFNDDEVKVIEGEDLVEVKPGANNTYVVTGKQGKTGKVVIEVEDKRGVWGRYELELVDPAKFGRDLYYKLATTSEFIASQRNNTFEIVQGSEFATVDDSNGEWTLKPKSDAVNKRIVVVEKTAKGVELNRYTLDIIKGVSRKAVEQRVLVPEGGDVTFPPMESGREFVVVAGNEYVKTETVKNDQGVDEFRVTPNDGSAGNIVRIEELDENGDLLRTAIISIVPAGIAQKQSDGSYKVNADNRDPFKDFKVDNSIHTGAIDIKFPDSVYGLSLTKNEDKVNVIPTEDGIRVVPKDGEDGVIETGYIFVTEDGQSLTENTLKLKAKLKVDNSNVPAPQPEGTAGSSELTGECIAAITLPLVPLLIAIPVGILSQVQIPGLEGLSAQINAAIQEANNQIQRGLGIYDEDRAQRAAGIQGAFQVANPEMIGMAAGALGVITAGLLLADWALHACGADEFTSSYQVGKATDSEWLMNGSSNDPKTEKQKERIDEHRGTKPADSDKKTEENKADAK